jgi:Zn-dependent peptidase ImmA (M78 family)/transcriptional regulator with XRE-family HTH domain
MKQQIIGQRIRSIREKYGLSQEEVEKSLGLSQKAMTRIETGQRSASSLELAQLSELLYCSILDFFPEKGDEEDVLVTLYRLSPGLEADLAVKKEVAKYVQICREGVFLEELLNRSSRKRILSYPFPYPAGTLDAVRQGDLVAKEERKRLGLGNRPIHDIVDLLTSQGIWCAGAELPAEMAGLFLFRPSIGVAILVNGRHAKARKKFSYAHEYAHAIFDKNHHVLVSTTANASEFIETRANAFAAAFLLPSEGVAEMIHSLGKGGASRTDHAIFDAATQGVVEIEERLLASRQKITPRDIALIAHHFGVSYQATVYRLRSLHYLSHKERKQSLNDELHGKSYLKMLGLNDLDKSEKNSINQRELKTYISQLMIEAYQGGQISRGRLLELSRLLKLPGRQILEIAEDR